MITEYMEVVINNHQFHKLCKNFHIKTFFKLCIGVDKYKYLSFQNSYLVKMQFLVLK